MLFTIILWYNKANAPEISLQPQIPETPATTTLLAVGDIMLSRNVAAKIDAANDPNLPFEKLRDLTSTADIAFANLECPLSSEQRAGGQGLVFRCPARYVSGLEHAGFDVLSTANNHSFDQGLDNLEFTIDYLRSKNILPIGTTPSLSPPREGEMKEGVIVRNDIIFGFLAYSYTAFNDGGKSTHPQIATMNIEQMRKDVSELESLADVTIVSMHAGTEYTRRPNQQQIDFAHAAIDAGADVVIGHHPHWIQEIEIYSPPRAVSAVASREGWEEGLGEVNSFFPPLDGEGQGGVKKIHRGIIFYSLGNFVFDQMWSQETREGLMVKFEFQGSELKSYELIPVIIDNYCCPRLATEEEKINILKKSTQKQK